MKLFLSIFLLVISTSGVAQTTPAGPITFCNVCDNFKLTQKGNDLLITCPPSTTPVMTYKNCPNAKAKKVGGQINLTCGTGTKQMPIVPKASTKLDEPAK